ncbi:MAG TPA: hypothetical protein VGR91_13445 [Stellaceae bacterium]|nr:hypothetical protein [Stellaceae bacterium]
MVALIDAARRRSLARRRSVDMQGWKYWKAFFVSLIAGGIVGLAFGFAANDRRYLGLWGWLSHSDEAVFWILAGAALGGCVVYLWRLLQSN